MLGRIGRDFAACVSVSNSSFWMSIIGTPLGAMESAVKRRKRSKLGQDRVLEYPLANLRPSPENDRPYRQRGVIEPLVATSDGYILSGHRRFVAARLAGLKQVPVRVVSIRRTDDIDAFVRLLRVYNRQSDKTLDEKLREEIVSVNPQEAYQSLIEHRTERARIEPDALELRGKKQRCEISAAKEPMLTAILQVIGDSRNYWDLDRANSRHLPDKPLGDLFVGAARIWARRCTEKLHTG